jgi:hypothetical protein
MNMKGSSALILNDVTVRFHYTQQATHLGLVAIVFVKYVSISNTDTSQFLILYPAPTPLSNRMYSHFNQQHALAQITPIRTATGGSSWYPIQARTGSKRTVPARKTVLLLLGGCTRPSSVLWLLVPSLVVFLSLD